jgi:hypothetical protein
MTMALCFCCGALKWGAICACADNETCLCAFVHYISEKHPNILRVQLAPEMCERVADLLQGLTLPEVTIRRTQRRMVTGLGFDRTPPDRPG